MSGWSGPLLPQAGWYADPTGAPGTIRWWDGARWSDATGRIPGFDRLVAGAPGQGSGRAQMAAHPAGEGPGQRIPARAVWWALLGLAVGELAGGLLGSIVAAITGDSPSSAPVTLAGEVGLWSGMLSACLVVVRTYGSGSLRRDLRLHFRPVDLAWGPLVTVAGLVATAVLSQPFHGTRLSGSNTSLIDGQTHNTAGFAVIAVIVSLGAPLFEELFFRGLVRTALAARLGPIKAVLAQAGLFGLAHLNPATGLGNVEVVVVIAAFGIVLGMAAHLTGRLGPGMIGHGLYNLLVTIAILTG